MLTKGNKNLETVTHTYIESSNKLGLVSIFKNKTKGKYTKLVMQK